MSDLMRSTLIRALAATFVLLVLASPVAAQQHRAALGLTGGWSTYGDLTPGLGFTTELEPGWMAGAQWETWPGSGRVGVRLDGSYTERPLQGDPESDFNVYAADLALLVRLLRAGDGRWVAPYIAMGAGGAHYNGGNPATPLGAGAYGDDPVTRAMAMAGVGLDLAPSRRIGLRVEFADRVVLPSIGEAPESEGLPMTHNLQLQTALQLRMGRIGAAPVMAMAAMPAPAEPVVEAAAPAAEREVVELREQVGAWQGRLARLTERVDSLERALEEARSARLAASPANGPLGTPVETAAAVFEAPAPQPAAIPEAPSSPLFTVQVGAFVERATAARWVERLRDRNLPVWVAEVVVKGQRVNRVRVGALPSQAEADRLAHELKRSYGWPVWVDRVTDAEPVPLGAIAATRSFLHGE